MLRLSWLPPRLDHIVSLAVSEDHRATGALSPVRVDRPALRQIVRAPTMMIA